VGDHYRFAGGARAQLSEVPRREQPVANGSEIALAEAARA